MVENLALSDRLDEAEDLFRHLTKFANEVGLMAEEVNPETGEQLGNFPQGFSHIGLINAALRLEAIREGKPRLLDDVAGR
jgi:GH15 family glucan-1,4-alpha-glucosidase